MSKNNVRPRALIIQDIANCCGGREVLADKSGVSWDSLNKACQREEKAGRDLSIDNVIKVLTCAANVKMALRPVREYLMHITEPANFLPVYRPYLFGDFDQEVPTTCERCSGPVQLIRVCMECHAHRR